MDETNEPVETITYQEFPIRVSKDSQKKRHVMRFNENLSVDFNSWTSVKMERENNLKEYQGTEDDAPKYGAGSEYGKEAREEARRKKLGYATRKYKPEDQPWILKTGGGSGKKFKGIREGGVSENAAYYIFAPAGDGSIEAYPLNEWYKFQPIQRYKALSAEEAEEEFGKRNKVMNYFSLMLRKRLKGEDDKDPEECEESAGKTGGGKRQKELKISDMDEWMESSEESANSDEDNFVEEKSKKFQKAVARKKSNRKRDTDLEAFEDSDDGDGEGREVDYISDSSDSEHEPVKDLPGVSEEKALRKLLTSDEESDSDIDITEKDNKDDDEEDKTDNKEQDKEGENKKVKKKQKKNDSIAKKEKTENTKEKDSSSDTSSDSSDSEKDVKTPPIIKKEEEKENDQNILNNPKLLSPVITSPPTNKKKIITSDVQSVKKPKFETVQPNYASGLNNDSGITEEAVRRYLMRKPMTTTELLQKFKSKKTGLSSDKLVNIMTQILKKINPVKQTIKGKMYLSIKL